MPQQFANGNIFYLLKTGMLYISVTFNVSACYKSLQTFVLSPASLFIYNKKAGWHGTKSPEGFPMVENTLCC